MNVNIFKLILKVFTPQTSKFLFWNVTYFLRIPITSAITKLLSNSHVIQKKNKKNQYTIMASHNNIKGTITILLLPILMNYI